VIREASVDDAAAGAALRALVNPELVTNGEAYAYRMRTVTPSSRRRWWCAEVDGEVVGWATCGLVVETSEEGVANLDVDVHPEHRRRGIGTALVVEAERHIRAVAARRAFAWARGDEETSAFARGRGFAHGSSSQMLVVDPRTVQAVDPPEGVAVQPFRTFAADPSALYRVDTVAMLDEPNEVTLDAVDYGVWLERWWQHPLVDMDASMAVVVDGAPVSLTWLQADRETGRGSNNGTGTLREHRGRGYAHLAKRASLAAAAGLGIEAVYTGNDDTNRPMLAINRRLGYKRFSTMRTWTKGYVTSER